MFMTLDSSSYLLQTPRLGLRPWRGDDLVPLTALNQDPAVMKYFPGHPDLAATEAFIERMNLSQAEHGFCYFAVDRLDTGEFIGFIGLSRIDFPADFTPCVDLGWRLAQAHWGQGFATEGAKACLIFAFKELGIPAVYALAPAVNVPSERVMQKIGMEKVGTFDHPKLLEDERLRSCVLYRKGRG